MKARRRKWPRGARRKPGDCYPQSAFFSFLCDGQALEKPTPHCGRWSGSNRPGSCNYWGHCFPFGSGICNDKEVLITLATVTPVCKIHSQQIESYHKWAHCPPYFPRLSFHLGCFSRLLPPGPPSTEEKSNIYLTHPIQLATRLPRTRPVAASFSAANMLLSGLKRLFSYV